MTIAKQILVCDDEAAIRQIVATKLRAAGHTVYEARNGLEGYCHIDHSALPVGSKLPTAKPIVPDLVLTDLQMPLLSGLELAEKLRDHPLTCRVPVIMLTARGYALTPAQISRTNIIHLLPKPFGAKQLLETVEKTLSLNGPGAQAA